MKNIFFLISLFFLQNCMIGAGENSQVESNANGFFPQINGIDLQGTKRELPKSFEGKLNIVTVAFKREQQAEVDTWIPIAEEISKENPDIHFYEVPLIYELGAFSRTWINNGMRFGIPNEIARKRTITVYTDRKKFFELMKMEEDKIYTLLLDSDGKILWQTDGPSSKEKIQSLKKILKAKSKA